MARETINGISVPIPGTGEPPDFVSDLRRMATDHGPAVESRIATRQLGTRVGRSAKAGPYPDFVDSGVVLFDAADAGIESLYWPGARDCSAIAMPDDYAWCVSTDHGGINAGIRLGFSASPLVPPTTWTAFAPTGIPASLDQRETPTIVVDAANNRLVMLFSAQDTSAGNAQNTYVAFLTWDGSALTQTYSGRVTPFPTNWMGDGHGGYVKDVMPYGVGFLAWSLAGGTTDSFFGLRYTEDFITWVPVGGQVMSATDTTWKFPDWPNSCFFTWRGEQWAILVKGSIEPTGEYEHDYYSYVARVDRDLRTILTDPVPTFGGVASDTFIHCVIPDGDRLIGYYRHGGKTGDIRYAIAEG